MILPWYPGLRLGNWLYFLLHAWKTGIKVQYDSRMDDYIALFPKLKDLLSEKDITEENIVYVNVSYFQRCGIGKDDDFTSEELQTFISEFMVEDAKKLIVPTEDIIINIRRTDYYQDIQKSYAYGFNQIRYVKDALKHLDLKKVKTIGVVSDDKCWCQEHLAFLADKAAVTFYDTDPIGNFRTLLSAKQLIISNSTFSYWGAYLSQNIHSEAKIIAPDFGTYLIARGKSVADSSRWLLLPVETVMMTGSDGT